MTGNAALLIFGMIGVTIIYGSMAAMIWTEWNE